jgi:hypothetical protein
LQAALAALSDAEVERLLHAAAAEELRRWEASQERRFNAASLFKKVGIGAALLACLCCP